MSDDTDVLIKALRRSHKLVGYGNMIDSRILAPSQEEIFREPK